MAGLTFQQWIEIEFQVLHVLSHPWDAWDDRCHGMIGVRSHISTMD